MLTLKAPSKIAADDTFFFYFYLLKTIRLDVLCESSARQRIHMKYHVLFSLKNNEEIFMNVVCCSCDWQFKGKCLAVLESDLDNSDFVNAMLSLSLIRRNLTCSSLAV